MARGLLPVLLLLAAGLAACTEPSPPAVEPAPTPSPGALSLTACTGFHAYMGPIPPPAIPGHVPPGWEPSAQSATDAAVFVDGYECQRLGVGPFERGPVRIVADSHTGVVVPDACRRSEQWEGMSVLGTLWIDDAEVATYLAEALGLPARPAEIAVAEQATGPTARHGWTWAEAGSAGRSELSVLSTDLTDDATKPVLYFWPRGEGIASLSLVHSNATGPAVYGLPSFGALQPPALLATLPGGTFAGRAWWLEGFSAEGTFSSYRDALCTEPEPEAPA